MTAALPVLVYCRLNGLDLCVLCMCTFECVCLYLLSLVLFLEFSDLLSLASHGLLGIFPPLGDLLSLRISSPHPSLQLVHLGLQVGSGGGYKWGERKGRVEWHITGLASHMMCAKESSIREYLP